MSTTTTLPTRSEIPVEDTWDISAVFPSDQDWERACQEVTDQLPELEAFRGRLGESPTTLLAWFNASEKAWNLLEKIYFFAYTSQAVDTTNQAATAMLSSASSLNAQLGAATSFAEPELMDLDIETIRAWMAADPELASYTHYFDRLEHRKAHVRSAEVEEVLAMVSDPFQIGSGGTYGLLVNADLKFAPAVDSKGTEYEVAQGSIDRLRSNPDRTLRRTAWNNYADGFLAFKNTLASTLSAGIKQDVFNVRARKYDSSLEAVLAPNKIPVEVFHNLIAVFRKNIPTWHRYWRLRRQALGVDTLHYYDLWAPLSDHPPEVPFGQAIEWITAGMAPLGDEYVEVLRRGALEERWVDKYPNKGKRAGAFSYGIYGAHPFIMMSYNNRVFDLSTLAHELGHSMHSYFTCQTQPWIYSHYSTFVAEVASNFNQAMVRDYLFANETDRDFQIALAEETMANFLRYFFIMPSLARFELETHERVERGEPLTADGMIDLMAGTFQEGFGDKVILDHDRQGIVWATFGHLYSNFYVFQYATGISAANALARGILDGKAGAVERYLDFLKAGSALYPLDALQQAGVDLATPEPVQQAFDVLAGTVERLEELLG